MVRHVSVFSAMVGAALLLMVFSTFNAKSNMVPEIGLVSIYSASEGSEGFRPESQTKSGLYNLLVRKIQIRLAELGFYRGATGGVMSVETSDAIKDFQRYANIPINGSATNKLLEHLTAFTSDGRRLMIRIDEAQTEQINKARLALEEAFGLNWVREAKTSMVATELKTLAGGCSMVLTPACLIVEAEKAAKLIEADDLRDWALSDIIRVKARLGMIDEVLSVVISLSDPRSMIAALSGVAVSLSHAGKVKHALNTAKMVPDNILRDKALRAVAEGYMSSGQSALARQTVAMIEASHVRLPALVATAHSYLIDGNIKIANEIVLEAEEIAKGIESKLYYEWALGEIVGLLVAVGNSSKAHQIIDLISLPKNKVRALCDMTVAYVEYDRPLLAYQSLKAAQNAFSNIQSLLDQQQGRACIAFSNAKLGNFNDAIKEAKEIDLGFTRSFVLSRIAIELSSSGRLKEAEYLIKQISDKKLRIRGLIAIRNEATNVGYLTEAFRLGSKAINYARNMSNSLDKVVILSDIALSELMGGSVKNSWLVVQEATNIATNIKDPWGRARALSRVSGVLIIIGNI